MFVTKYLSLKEESILATVIMNMGWKWCFALLIAKKSFHICPK
tara:strand:- start:911 stop:1039 length:129 start_codon:yes stop_codon:yes gene_type:complete